MKFVVKNYSCPWQSIVISIVCKVDVIEYSLMLDLFQTLGFYPWIMHSVYLFLIVF